MNQPKPNPMGQIFDATANIAVTSKKIDIGCMLINEHAEKVMEFCDKVSFRVWVIAIIFLFFRLIENIVTVIYVTS